MSHEDWYVDADKLDPAEVIGTPRRLIEDGTSLLLKVEQSGSTLSPAECLRLFVCIAELRFRDWGKLDILWTEERRRKVDAAARDLYDRLRVQVGRHTDSLMNLLAGSLQALVVRIDEGVARHEAIRKARPDPWNSNTSSEFIEQVIMPRDDVGLVVELLGDLQVDLPPETSASIAEMDAKLKRWLPGVAEEFRRGGDSIDPFNPDLFPKSFWWRRLPGARPTET